MCSKLVIEFNNPVNIESRNNGFMVVTGFVDTENLVVQLTNLGNKIILDQAQVEELEHNTKEFEKLAEERLNKLEHFSRRITELEAIVAEQKDLLS